jgi:glyceraldehyde 3-phosphate dehydrogenase
MNNRKQGEYLKEWQSLEEFAELMLPLIGRLYRDHNIVTTV